MTHAPPLAMDNILQQIRINYFECKGLWGPRVEETASEEPLLLQVSHDTHVLLVGTA